MAGIVRIGDTMEGSVVHHAGHMIDEDPCPGHTVSGAQKSGSSKVFAEGIGTARKDDNGSTDCECDGDDYKNKTSTSKVFIEGLPAVQIGDETDIHGQGTGKMITGSSKVIIGG